MKQPHTSARPARVALATLAALAACVLASGSAWGADATGSAEPANGGTLRPHGSVSRLMWVPDGATVRLEGTYLSAGMVLGTRGALRSTLGPVAPAVVLELHDRSNLTLMSVGGRGAMLVWQHRL